MDAAPDSWLPFRTEAEGSRLLTVERTGEAPDLTDDWLRENMKPAEIINYRLAALAATVAGWQMETDHSDEEEQDEVLNEIRKKNESTE